MGTGRIENLKPFTSDQDREAARRNGRKGGIRSGEVRRARAEERRKAIWKEADFARNPWKKGLENSTFRTLSWRRRTFIIEYCNCFCNGAKAARLAGYRAHSAKGTAWKLLHTPEVVAGLRAWQKYVIREEPPD